MSKESKKPDQEQVICNHFRTCTKVCKHKIPHTESPDCAEEVCWLYGTGELQVKCVPTNQVAEVNNPKSASHIIGDIQLKTLYNFQQQLNSLLKNTGNIDENLEIISSVIRALEALYIDVVELQVLPIEDMPTLSSKILYISRVIRELARQNRAHKDYVDVLHKDCNYWQAAAQYSDIPDKVIRAYKLLGIDCYEVKPQSNNQIYGPLKIEAIKICANGEIKAGTHSDTCTHVIEGVLTCEELIDWLSSSLVVKKKEQENAN